MNKALHIQSDKENFSLEIIQQSINCVVFLSTTYFYKRLSSPSYSFLFPAAEGPFDTTSSHAGTKQRLQGGGVWRRRCRQEFTGASFCSRYIQGKLHTNHRGHI